MSNPHDDAELREYIYATYYGLVIREVWAKGGNELTASEKKFCNEITDKVVRLIQQRDAQIRIDEVKRSLTRGYFLPEMEVYAEDRIAALNNQAKGEGK